MSAALSWLRHLFGSSVPAVHRHYFRYVVGTIRALRIDGHYALYQEQWHCDACGEEETTEAWGLV